MWNSLPRVPFAAIGLTVGSLLSGAPSYAGEAEVAGSDPFPLAASWRPAPPGENAASADFRPRGRAMTDAPGADATATALPGADTREALAGTPAWQRLVQFETQNRVRLLTLWESSGASLSLQAGHRGSPSLQWSTHGFSPNAVHGLLDRWFPVIRARPPAAARAEVGH